MFLICSIYNVLVNVVWVTMRSRMEQMWSWVEMINPMRGRRMSTSELFQSTAAITQHPCWKKRMCLAAPIALLFSSNLVTALSQQETVVTVMSGPADWLSRLWLYATSRVWFVFLRMCQLQRARGKEGRKNQGSFFPTNTVTHLPINWVTSCTQTARLLSTSVPLQGSVIMSQVLQLYKCPPWVHWADK